METDVVVEVDDILVIKTSLIMISFGKVDFFLVTFLSRNSQSPFLRYKKTKKQSQEMLLLSFSKKYQ